MRQSPSAGPNELRWAGLYRAGGIAAFLIAALLLGEIAVYASLPRPETVLEHFELFEENPLAGLLTLDLLGMISYVLFIPTILALYVALRRASEAGMAVATVLFLVGIAAFFATNTAFSVLDLSQRYAEATTDADRAVILAAGQAMFTLFNENAFLVSYVIVSAVWLMIGTVMLRSPLFGRASAAAGIEGRPDTGHVPALLALHHPHGEGSEEPRQPGGTQLQVHAVPRSVRNLGNHSGRGDPHAHRLRPGRPGPGPIEAHDLDERRSCPSPARPEPRPDPRRTIGQLLDRSRVRVPDQFVAQVRAEVEDPLRRLLDDRLALV